ncbi:MAG TPA: SDR family oxidoreductase [Hyphomicrobiaceae bacterium]
MSDAAPARSSRLQGKTAVVMGGGSSNPEGGLSNGQAVAIAFARAGAKLVVVDVNKDAAQVTVGLIEKEGGVALAMAADVSKAPDVEAVIRAAVEKHGRIDILHNNVGIEYMGDVVDTPEEAWDRVHDVNIKSVFLACKYAIPEMEKGGGGAIINISSTASLKFSGVPYIAYNSSKAALNHMTQIIARQYAHKQIRCNAILPGMMDTPHIRTLYKDLPPEKFKDVMAARDAKCPMGRQGTCWDVANAAVFLASEEASYVNGVLLKVDGASSI